MSRSHRAGSRRSRRLGVVAGGVAVLAIAGAGFTQAFASAGHGANRGGTPGAAHKAIRSGAGHAAHAHSSTTSLGHAITSVTPGTISDSISKGDVYVLKSRPSVGVDQPIDWAGLQFTPDGGSASGTVYAFFDSPGGAGAKNPVCGADPESGYTWQDCQTSTLPDGSQVRTSVSTDGEAAQVWRLVDGVVERVYAYAPSPGSDPVLSADQLVKVVAQLNAPTS